MGANVASFAQANRSLPPVRAPVAKSELAPARADERLMGFPASIITPAAPLVSEAHAAGSAKYVVLFGARLRADAC